MTLNKVFSKLRKYNKKNYRQLKMCIVFATLLISSFISTVLNPAIQETLPIGGDSRKQVYMIFVVAVIGCLVFTIYAAGLFLRYKSKEIGVFMALGTEKKQLTKTLYREMIGISIKNSIIGIIGGTIISYFTLQIFQMAFPFSIGKIEYFSAAGLLVSIFFGILVSICVVILSARFMKRTNIIDILNEQRKNERINGNITRRYFIIGVICLVMGILIAGVGAQVYSRIMKQTLGIWVNLFYVVSLFGLYRILVYSIAVHKRGRNPQKYYRNIISYGLLKFQGASIVKNMLIVSLLIVCSLFACLYSPTKYMSERDGIENNPIDFSLSYPLSSDEVVEDEIRVLAEKYNVEITDYYEADFIRLLGSGVNREDVDENGKIIEVYEKERMYFSFIDAKTYNAISGENIQITDGTYRMIRSNSMYENQFNQYSDLDYVSNPDTGINMELEYDGTVEFSGLVTVNGFDGLSRYVISDNDYAKMKEGLPQELIVRNILFNVKDLDESYIFAQELYRQYCDRASNDMLKMTGYDEFQEKIALEKDGYYAYSDMVQPNADHPEEYCDWKYTPNFKILNINNGFISFGIFYMLFIYVTVICLAAVGIISYTRSMTVAVKNKKVFEDVKKLGANKNYLTRILTDQIRRVYILPTVIGCLVMLLWYPLMLWQNDGRMTGAEFKVIMVEVLLCAIISGYQYVVYWLSVNQAKKVVIDSDGV